MDDHSSPLRLCKALPEFLSQQGTHWLLPSRILALCWEIRGGSWDWRYLNFFLGLLELMAKSRV
jgi:hypothetical protein